MKKSSYFPFERNRYFYGKLLTVRDFDSEQKYVNDKRRLINRLLFGAGVVAGLQVTPVDDQNLAIGAGVALDGLGREIIIPAPFTVKLSMVKGFSFDTYTKNLYLCLAYKETETEPVHTVGKTAEQAGDSMDEYNRVVEGYEIFVQEAALSRADSEFADLFEDCCVLCQEGDLSIRQRAPRYVNPGEVFQVTMTIEKSLRPDKVHLEYELDGGEHFAFVDPADGKVIFDEPMDRQDTRYERTLTVQAGKWKSDKAQLGIRDGSIRINLGDRQVTARKDCANTVGIIEQAVEERILADYTNRTLDRSLASPVQPCLYLAKISLFQIGSTYRIEKVEALPFDERVYGTGLLARLERRQGQASNRKERRPSEAAQAVFRTEARRLEADQEPYFQVGYNEQANEYNFRLGIPAGQKGAVEMTTGAVTVWAEKANSTGKILFVNSERTQFTGEIDHGLGLGPVLVEVGIEEHLSFQQRDMSRVNRRLYFGAIDLFADSPYDTGLGEIAVSAVAFPDKGSFVIAVRFPEGWQGEAVILRWWAYKAGAEKNNTLALQEASVSTEGKL
ncbi:hypothetical protein GTO89_14805 [Heliobacterium gestii]|uniref:Uncharacterized protein n=1 Tax=Heliomicrobium gestii TaxID=2699 RepID=A0A845LCB9_HELGE|nr:hypothetical protein [Heliomicrobium gestii]MBM7868036.1 hypothetical protein [Heliomicrobium gestii]MZP44302.1 hypothetical protein [Heliomicrobium gestii]